MSILKNPHRPTIGEMLLPAPSFLNESSSFLQVKDDNHKSSILQYPFFCFHCQFIRVTEENLVFEMVQSGPYSSFEYFQRSKRNWLLYFMVKDP